jgi:hypothetical protein
MDDPVMAAIVTRGAGGVIIQRYTLGKGINRVLFFPSPRRGGGRGEGDL